MARGRRRSHSMKGAISWQMAEILNDVSEEVRAAVERALKIVPDETAEDLRQTSPQDHGDYAKSWAVKREGSMSAIVHNKEHYRLTHLLEHGHTKANQYGKYPGRVPARVHIKPAEQRAAKRFQEVIEEELNKNL